MTPELRKEASELQLHKRGIRINVQLHVIEADEEVTLRSKKDVEARLWALWAVSQAAVSESPEQTRTIYEYLRQHDLLEALSTQESAFLTQVSINPEDHQTFIDRQHSFHFLAWCAGLLDKIDLSSKPIKSESILQYFPAISVSGALNGTAIALMDAIKLRRKDVIMDWSDLLYRLHWAVRHAQLNDKSSPGNIDNAMVREWHQAVNWMCCYDDEPDWDKVSTETTA
nr:DUF4272 domain-containing protein [uncultured Undibacterium sp.]